MREELIFWDLCKTTMSENKRKNRNKAHGRNEGQVFLCQFHLLTNLIHADLNDTLFIQNSKKWRWGVMRQQYTHTKTHTEDFCPSSASGLGQLCCASQPRVSSPVSQAAEAPQGTTNSWQTGATAIYHPNHTYACVSLPVFVCRCILLNHKHGNPSCSRVCVERTGTNKHEAASC